MDLNGNKQATPMSKTIHENSVFWNVQLVTDWITTPEIPCITLKNNETHRLV